eukprot:4972990-Pyramimonas_sp.AAC.1
MVPRLAHLPAAAPRARYTIPTLRMERMARQKPPHLVAGYKLFKVYGTLGEITVTDDRWRC